MLARGKTCEMSTEDVHPWPRFCWQQRNLAQSIAAFDIQSRAIANPRFIESNTGVIHQSQLSPKDFVALELDLISQNIQALQKKSWVAHRCRLPTLIIGKGIHKSVYNLLRCGGAMVRPNTMSSVCHRRVNVRGLRIQHSLQNNFTVRSLLKKNHTWSACRIVTSPQVPTLSHKRKSL